jgi:hypothetical protein
VFRAPLIQLFTKIDKINLNREEIENVTANAALKRPKLVPFKTF